MNSVFKVSVLVFLFPLAIGAQPISHVSVGTNFTYLRSQGGETSPGINIGIGKDFDLSTEPNFFISANISYTTRNVQLRNKTWPANSEPAPDVSVGDIPLDRSYGVLTILFNYEHFYAQKKLGIQFFGGPSLSIPLKYLNRIKGDSTIFLKPEERGSYPFDYQLCGNDDDIKDFIYLSIGMGLIYKRHYGVQLRYMRAVQRQKCIRGLNINDALDSINLSLVYRF